MTAGLLSSVTVASFSVLVAPVPLQMTQQKLHIHLCSQGQSEVSSHEVLNMQPDPKGSPGKLAKWPGGKTLQGTVLFR